MPEVEVNDSILLSVKNHIGIPPDVTDLDSSILVHINAAIFTLRQMGIGPISGYSVTSPEQTYSDYLGYGSTLIPEVRDYLGNMVHLRFDTPSNSNVTEVLKEAIQEAQWRLVAEGDVKAFDEEVSPWEIGW